MLFQKKNTVLSRTFKQYGLLEIIFFILLAVMACSVLYQIGRSHYNKKEGFTQEKNIKVFRGNEVFDDFYVSIYDKLVLDDNKLNVEVYEVLDQVKKNDPFNILDIGCSTGHHVYQFSSLTDHAVGVDISPSMIKKAKENYPKCKYILGDALDHSIAKPQSYTHVNCVYFTIYYLHDKPLFFKNSYNWLKPGGYLILHVVNPEKFDPIVSAGDPFDLVKPQEYSKKRITETEVEFNGYNYNAKYNYYKKEKKASFQEKIVNKETQQTRYNEHILYMPSISEILDQAKQAGFIIVKKKDLAEYDYKYQYIYTFQKPT